jgi:hypothetical protein
LLQLDDVITFNQLKNKVKLPISDVPNNSLASLSSWGATINSNTDTPKQLQKATFNIVKNSECYSSVEYTLHEDQFCAIERVGIGACYVSF